MATDTTASTSSSRATERLRARLAAGLAGGLALTAGCGGAPVTAMPDAGPAALLGTVDNIVSFEGQHAFVTLVHAPIALEGAHVTLPAELDVREVRCAGSACAIVAEVLDTTPSTGTPIPSPIDALVRQIAIEVGSDRVLATVNVMPLDQISNVGSAATVQGTYFASSVEATGGAMFRGAAGGDPIRWLVFGDVLLNGAIDVSAMGSVAGAGGFDGGEIGAAATGEGAGAVGEGGGSAWAAGCAADFFATECGGGGGGGDGMTAGGGGGGAVALVSLGRITFDGDVTARGGDGAGGGAGGRVLVSGVAIVSAPTVDTSGGAGAAGSNGDPGEEAETVTSALAGELDLPRYILDVPVYAIDGTAPNGASLRAESIDGDPLGSVVVGADGSFHLDATVPAGLTRIRLYLTTDGIERRLFVGNHVELERRSGRAQPEPIGGLIDVVYLPSA
jgi:hypothetical protein